MQILLKNIKYILLSITLVFCLLAAGCSQQLYRYSAPIEAQHYPVLKYTLVELIGNLPKPLPITLKQAQVLFNNQLHLKNKNELFGFYTAGPFITRDGVIVTNVDLITRKNSKIPVENINFFLDQRQCVSTKLLKNRYNLNIRSLLTLHPVENPAIGYSANLDWGGFGVGTTLDNEDCATSIGVGLK
ncbi:hypothetical protein [Commensalibacter papalotli (ex Botero et al. 2024)]|uniref:hypothetical protein n=1 Tax=Commensalibacter papalotli (ex Botero et al. 2024) TaxID=2972766 RepID=UPI0024936ABC|nr:hypothetical protein [Commensalibacter papalotli (ex Botero et al. 2024)]